jgi:hypothetical protein
MAKAKARSRYFDCFEEELGALRTRGSVRDSGVRGTDDRREFPPSLTGEGLDMMRWPTIGDK